MKKLSTSKMWLFAIGQFGWSLLSGIITNWMVYFYQPDNAAISAGHKVFIPQGRIILGAFTVLGMIAAVGRVFDAFTDPYIASKSDRCTSKLGRRIPFLKWSALPFAVFTVLVFITPVNGESYINVIWLLITTLLYYISITAYCTPYAALIPELGHTQEERLNISTAISLTFFFGLAFSYAAPVIWGTLEGTMGRVAAMRTTFAGMAVIAFICMLVPVFAINEKDYVNTVPTENGTFASLVNTFKNKDFRVFVASDILYWIALTMFQTGLPFFVTSLLKLNESMSTVYFVVMTVLSVLFYMPVNIIARKTGKKKLVLLAFLLLTVAYGYSAFLGKISIITPEIQGFILVIIASLPMAIFGILPQAMVAYVAESDAKITKENREGMFYAARTFSFKLGQSISMVLFTAMATIGRASGKGYRIVAITSAVLCILGGIILTFFNEKKINEIIDEK